MSRFQHFAIILFFLSMNSCAAQDKLAQTIATTDHFEFYINKWLNQHHFLFQTAKRLAKDSTTTIKDFPHWQELSSQEQQLTEELMGYYQEHWIGKSLLFNRGLYSIKRTITQWPNRLKEVEFKAYPELAQYWSRFAPIYERFFWLKHQAQNEQVLQYNLPRIRAYEKQATARLSQLSQETWPVTKIRVDVTYLADWAGAYTTTNPVHIVTSTKEVGPEGDWVETLFHEASHKLISGRRGKVSALIQKIAKEEALEIPRQLWHGILFYFSGAVIKDLLVADGIDYQLYMIRENVFGAYQEALAKSLDPYLDGSQSLETAIRKLLISLQ
ncbi:MAG: hypothetical protein HRU41_25115 [Saprospiraceae bacterium]|nr:hypothetical protein [Saprospiraceae bacterium]